MYQLVILAAAAATSVLVTSFGFVYYSKKRCKVQSARWHPMGGDSGRLPLTEN